MELKDILLSALGLLVSGLATWLVSVITGLINQKIKDKKLASYLLQITTIAENAVKTVYQTYVEAIKGTDEWDVAHQHEAFHRAYLQVQQQLSEELKKFITDNYGDIGNYLSKLIEATIYSLK